jgi:salicylate hydroxylase
LRNALQGVHLLHCPIAGCCLINFLAVVDGPDQWTAPSWVQEAVPGGTWRRSPGWHLAVTDMLTAVPQSPGW